MTLTAGTFVLADGTGNTLTFDDFSTSTPTGRPGKLLSATDAWNVAGATAWTSAGHDLTVKIDTAAFGTVVSSTAGVSSGPPAPPGKER